jgi:anaerobic magnesium-protoporphyrin IX monomethyl ester cyclase
LASPWDEKGKRLKSVLVCPAYRFETLTTTEEPLGLLYVGAAMREAGYSPHFVDLTFEKNLKPLADQIRDADCVAFSSTTQLFPTTREVLASVRKVNPSVKTIIGGPHATAFVEDALSAFDVAVVGEGERTMPDLLRCLDNGGSLADVPGIAFKHKDEIAINGARPFIRNLDDIPFPLREWADYSRYRRVGLIATRGCPYRCRFCKPMQDKLFGKRIRSRSPENVATELVPLARDYPQRVFTFKDDMLTVNETSWFRELSEHFTARGIRIRWQCNSRVDTVNYEKLASMKQAGCYHIYFGVESGSQRILDFYRKGASVKQAIEAFDLCHRLGILPNASVILGAPDETREDMEQTFQLIKRLKPYKWLVHIATPFPGNDLYDYAKHHHLFTDHFLHGGLVSSANLYAGKFPMKLKHVTPEDVLRVQRKIDRHMKRRFLLRSILMPSLWRELITSSGLRREAIRSLKKHFNPFRRRNV